MDLSRQPTVNGFEIVVLELDVRLNVLGLELVEINAAARDLDLARPGLAGLDEELVLHLYLVG